MSRGTMFPLLLVLASCSSHQYFRPREAALVDSPSGYPAAQYALGEAPDRVGRLNVWSRGAEEVTRDDGTWTSIHLGLEIANTSQGVLSVVVDEIELHSVSSETRRIEVVDRSVYTGLPRVPAEQVGRMDFQFLVDPEVEPTSIESFAARWMVENEDGGTYSDLTVFQADGYYGYGYWGYSYWPAPYWGYPYWGYPFWGYGWYPW